MDWHTVSRLSPHMHQTREGYVVIRDVTVPDASRSAISPLAEPRASFDCSVCLLG
jgi:hypothetical protein